jgi:hypothetical protein
MIKAKLATLAQSIRLSLILFSDCIAIRNKHIFMNYTGKLLALFKSRKCLIRVGKGRCHGLRQGIFKASRSVESQVSDSQVPALTNEELSLAYSPMWLSPAWRTKRISIDAAA